MEVKFESLTALQVELVDAVYGIAGNDPQSYQSMVVDNFSWFLPIEVQNATGWTKEKTGGVISGALEAGLIGSEDGEYWVNEEVWKAFMDAVEAGVKTQA